MSFAKPSCNYGGNTIEDMVKWIKEERKESIYIPSPAISTKGARDLAKELIRIADEIDEQLKG